MDTIFALTSAAGRAGVSVVRISGPLARQAVRDIAGSLPPPRRAGLRRLRRPSDGGVLDEGLVLDFPGPESFTGEDVVELHVHGSTAIIDAVLHVLAGFDGLRMAEPGEFTRRALENDRLDLAQVEGLADLIEAETEAQRVQAQRVLAGQLGELAERWRSALIRAAALLEVTIDFADEEVPEDVFPEVSELLTGVETEMRGEMDGVGAAERIRAGFEVAIVGAPNVGKSTLLNALSGRDAAITSEYAGTTRDVIEVRMDLGGLPVTVLDTAGLRETADKIEEIGIERAITRARQADLRVFLVEGDDAPLLVPETDDIVLRAKADLNDGAGDGVSGKTGAGVPELVAAMAARLKSRSAVVGVATRFRHLHAMTRAVAAIADARNAAAPGPEQYDIAAEELRTAIRALDSLIGRVGVENLLDEIFSSFCLGK